MLAMNIPGVDSSVRLHEPPVEDWRDRMLEELALHVPRMDHAHATRQDFWMWFEGEAASVVRGATELRTQLLSERLDSLLKKAGIKDRYPP